MTDVVGTPQPIKGTQIRFKATSGGTFTVINKALTRKVPRPTSVTEETTAIDSACVSESNQINDYGDLELEILYDEADTGHAALLANVGSRVDGFWEIQTPDGRVMSFRANSKQFGDKNGGPKNNQKADFKAHCNTVPAVSGP